MGIPRIQAFFNGRSNLQLFCKSQYVTYITAKNLLLVKMKEKKLLKIQSLPKVLRSQATV